MEIRRATPDDIDALAALFDGYRQFYRQPSDLAGARAFLSERLEHGESIVFLALHGGRAVGFTQLYPSFTSAGMARIFVLNDLYVQPDARARGIGTGLLRRAAQFARDEGVVRLALSTEKTNATAQALYEREGWQRDDAFLSYTLPL